MEFSFSRAWTVSIWVVFAMFALSLRVVAQSPSPQTQDAKVTRAVGTIKSTQADSLVLTPDSGNDVTANLSATTKILRVPPGETDLKNATPLQAQDLQAGDRVLVRGQASADGKSLAALAVIVMKQSDVSARKEQDREDWQKRGVGGMVSAVDTTAGTITISSAGLAGKRDIAIHSTPKTNTRRYAPDSVKFDDARSATIDQIKAGDQLRARGTRNADGSELIAEDIVFGSFRNVAGTVTAIDSASNSITVQDAMGKASVSVKVTSDSQIKKLPAEMAQRIAMRLKGGAPGAEGGAGATGQQRSGPPPGTATGGGPQNSGWSGGNAPNGNGASDLQRFLGRLPDTKLTDLQKGDAVMIVATQGGDAGTVTAITVLAGVEPILTASPNRNSITLSPWSLNNGGGVGDSTP